MQALNKLSNEQLETSFRNHVRAERKMLHVILEHIREVFRRDLHLQKHSSMIDYLTKEFGYSETCARQRVAAARLMKDVPALAEKLQDGSMNLSKVAELQRAVREKEATEQQRVSSTTKLELVELISGKSLRESQQVLAQALEIEIKESDREKVQQNHSVRIEFTLTKEQNAKLQKVREMASHTLRQELKDLSVASVLEVLMDSYLDQKIGRAEKPEQLATAQTADREYAAVTPKLRQLVLQRDQVCQHRAGDGAICGSRQFLESDHIVPLWAGGKNTVSNLQALCGNHNRMKYRKQAQIRLL